MVPPNKVLTLALKAAQEVLKIHNQSASSPFPVPNKKTVYLQEKYRYAFYGYMVTFTLPRDDSDNARYLTVYIVEINNEIKAVRADIYNHNLTFPRYYLEQGKWVIY